MIKRILITGGDGFIAKSLNKFLLSDYEIYLCNREKLNLLDSEEVFKYLKKNNFDVIIHSATYDAAPRFSTKDPSNVLENNLKMFFNLARCSAYFKKMIYFGSGAEFDRSHWKPKMKEDYFDCHIPTDQYGFSKYIMAKYALASDKIYNLRLFGICGEHDDWRYRFISNACCKAVLGLPIVIKQDVFFDYLYIGDLMKIVNWFIENKPRNSILEPWGYQVYNICSGNSYKYSTIAEKIIKISSKDLDIQIQSEKLGQEYSGNNSLIVSELGDFKFTSIDKSIKIMYDWYNSNKGIIKKELFEY